MNLLYKILIISLFFQFLYSCDGFASKEFDEDSNNIDSLSNNKKPSNTYSVLNDKNFIIYKNSYELEVINLENNHVTQQSFDFIDLNLQQIKELYDKMYEQEEVFGSWTLKTCKREEFYCSRHALHISIPKGEIPLEWEFDNQRCSLLSKKNIKNKLTYKINCRTVEHIEGLSTTFSYSKELGIERYNISCKKCEGLDYDFTLLSKVGLFAQ